MIRALFRRGKRLLLLPALAVGLSACGVESIPRHDQETRAAWGAALTQYQRRSDLVPNFVGVVAGYAQNDQQTVALVEMRNKAAQMQMQMLPHDILTNSGAFKQFQENQAALSGPLVGLLAATEQYPALQTEQNFLSLRMQLETTERRIADARRAYGLAAGTYNAELGTFSGPVVAAILYPEAKVRVTFMTSIVPSNGKSSLRPSRLAPSLPLWRLASRHQGVDLNQWRAPPALYCGSVGSRDQVTLPAIGRHTQDVAIKNLKEIFS